MQFHGTDDEFLPFKGGKGKGVRTDFYSVDHSIRAWVKADGCPEEPKVEDLPKKTDDGTSVQRKTHGPGREGAEVILFVINGGGHTWPGREPGVRFLGKSTHNISANDLMWEFFRKHPMPTPEAKGTKTSMKGWELYVWQKDGDTHFSLLPGTNRLKTDDEITKAAVKGIGAIKPKLDELKPGQEVFVVGKKLMEPSPKDQAEPGRGIRQEDRVKGAGPVTMIRLGLCCIFREAPIKFRTTTATVLKRLPRNEGRKKLADLCAANAAALLER